MIRLAAFRSAHFCPRIPRRRSLQLRESRRGLWHSSWLGFQAAHRLSINHCGRFESECSSSLVGSESSRTRNRSAAAAGTPRARTGYGFWPPDFYYRQFKTINATPTFPYCTDQPLATASTPEYRP